MSTKITVDNEHGISIVSASNAEDDYIIWQKDENESGQIYFEYNDQSNSGYDTVTECTIDIDGCHLVLNNGDLVHFYWNPPRPKELESFANQLKKMYSHDSSIINYLD